MSMIELNLDIAKEMHPNRCTCTNRREVVEGMMWFDGEDVRR